MATCKRCGKPIADVGAGWRHLDPRDGFPPHVATPREG